ncbi:Acetyltransferase [Lentilactobacillus hilgardii]|uniref:GNAT family N-acetyltransferase n=1 Tax=Lentilactobacillus hilgardii TaxID=1588 RepID=UPI00019C5443|nr:GNAT family N-acetyltransferase [Lentilactobacillus hilgardii]EEI20449.1 acetyltransferase, GNAT family [Lentilactobacillus buchneri ATCC 11577]MCT3395346.1 GNAT family N-acetyltransferase [Lentilactobacillus hilgardii]QIR08548.1 Acetyltransferase [Lentilactobacillus hilgardii]
MVEVKKTNQLNRVYQDAQAIRKSVFVKEQGIDETLEFDGTDGDATHYVAYAQHRPVATARATVTGEGVHIQRVATLKMYRHKGFAKQLLEAILNDPKYKGETNFYLGAQETAKGLYETLGFKQYGDPFMEVGIKHVNMKKSVRN